MEVNRSWQLFWIKIVFQIKQVIYDQLVLYYTYHTLA